MTAVSLRTKMLAAMGLTSVSTTVGVLYKVSQAVGGGFQFSTISAICIAEFIKLCMSCTFHILDASHRVPQESRMATAWDKARSQLSRNAVLQISGLACLYAFNNQLSFYVYMLADPGTIFLFKAGSTLIVATIQCACLGKFFSAAQWKALFLQCVGMVIVQYNSCQGKPRYSPLAYWLMAASTVLSALCAVRNEYLVKNFEVGLNVQNAVLYIGGFVLNFIAFHSMPNPNSKQVGIGFFHGYSNPMAIGVVFSNAMIGLAITAGYKYADAVTKCISSDITAVFLCIISSFFFELAPSVTMWCGVLVVCFSVHLYTEAASSGPLTPDAQRMPPASPGIMDEEGLDHEMKFVLGKQKDVDLEDEEQMS